VFVGQYLNRESGSTEFVVDKARRLFDGITTSGFLFGDETGRGALFMLSLDTFLANPMTGIGLSGLGTLIGYHSSWIDPWAMFGLVGYLPFFVLQILLTRRVIRNWVRQPSNVMAFGSVVCWILFWLAGALNPTIYWVLPGVFLFSDCHYDLTKERTSVVALERNQSNNEINASLKLRQIPVDGKMEIAGTFH
jgi:hypothetical protein